MHDEIRARFSRLGNFPSPPAIAQEVLRLAKNPDIGMTEVAAVIARDPGLSAKILRIANSPLYAQRRPAQNVRQALMVMGIDTVMTLCLGFSITAGFRSRKAGALDYTAYWRHCLLCALGARCLAEAGGAQAPEDVFLAGLLADLGILALDRAQPEFYRPLAPAAAHAERVAFEREHLAGEDHAALAAWLFETWQLPAPLVEAVRRSHEPVGEAVTAPADRLSACLALGAELAGALDAPGRRAALEASRARVARVLMLDDTAFSAAITRLSGLSHEIGTLFDTALMDGDEALALIEEAQDMLAARTAAAVAERDGLREETRELEARSARLSDESRRDSLTGVYNRGHFDAHLSGLFATPAPPPRPVALLFVDLDHFKRINDTHGHLAGDAVLRETAALLGRTLRAQDLLARYGGEEFVVLLPGLGAREAVSLGQRMLAALRAHRHELDGQAFSVTASIGLAVHSPEQPFADAPALVGAADSAVYQAKRTGRDRLVAHGMLRAVAAAG